MGMIDSYEELCCISISFKTYIKRKSDKDRGCSFCCIFLSLIEFRLRSFFTLDLLKRSFVRLVSLHIAKLRSNPCKTGQKTQKHTKKRTKTSVQSSLKTNNTYSQCPAEVKVVKV